MKTMHHNMSSSGASFISVNSTRSEPAPSIHGQGASCPNCIAGHIVQAVEGRYIHADYLDKYLALKYKGCKTSRMTRLEHHIITVPEALHEKEIRYLQQATTRGVFRPGFVVPLQKVPKARTI